MRTRSELRQALAKGKRESADTVFARHGIPAVIVEELSEELSLRGERAGMPPKVAVGAGVAIGLILGETENAS